MAPGPRLAAGAALVVGLVLAVSWLQSRFDRADARKGIALAMAHRPVPGGPSVFEALVARGEGDPSCAGEVVSVLFGDVRVRCATPARPAVAYAFRVLLDGRRPPRAEGGAAEALVAALGGARPANVAGPLPPRTR